MRDKLTQVLEEVDELRLELKRKEEGEQRQALRSESLQARVQALKTRVE